MIDDKKLKELFVEEVSHHINIAREALNRFFENQNQNELFKIIKVFHTIKGSAGIMGLGDFAELLHLCENFFQKINNRELSPDEKIKSIRMLDVIENLIKNFPENYNTHIATLNELIKAQNTKPEQNNLGAYKKGVEIPSTDDKVEYKATQSNQIEVNTDVVLQIRGIIEEINQIVEFGFKPKDKKDKEKYKNKISDLIEYVERISLVPLSELSEKIKNIAYYAATVANKKIKIDIDFNNLGVDKNLLYTIEEALIHLVRNAVSHGIEEPEIRKKKKKDEKGNIKIVATGQGSRIKIVVEDDGAGIDFEKVVKKAIFLKLITEDLAKTLSKKEILNFIFTTNFSTADQIDTLSGRGVGLDIVKDKIESIGGTIFVDTSEKGTVFTFEVPVSLSILNCIVISTSGKKIGIPINLIKKIVKIKEDMIINDGNTEKLIYEDIPYSFVRLSQLSGEDVDSEKMGALTANDNICIIFEQFVGEKLFSVKGLSGIIGRIPQVIGFSIDDNFDPIAVINPVKIKIDKQPTTNISTKTPKEQRSALVADDNNLIREMIAEFLSSIGIEVTAAKDGKEAFTLFKNRKFDMVITDIEMPEMDGISFLKEIRKVDNVIPVLILSSRGEPQDIALGLQNGANGYFVKKFFSKDGFLKKVQSLL